MSSFPDGPEFIKELSANDAGETNSHQSGFLIPKGIARTGYFPNFSNEELNPRQLLTFTILNSGQTISLNYIHYNSKVLKLGSRHEYRLTGTSGFIREFELKSGDEIAFGLLPGGRRAIEVCVNTGSAETGFDTSTIGQNQPYISKNGWLIRER